MKVADLMNPSVITIAPEESAALAARLISRHNVGSLPVCGRDGRLRGIVTDRDIVLRCVAPGGGSGPNAGKGYHDPKLCHRLSGRRPKKRRHR